MRPDMMRRLQRQTTELGRLARDLATAAPQQSEGSDATGLVRVTLGHDGLPAEIRVRDGWRQRIEPDRLASAVLDANTQAVQGAMRTWATAVDDGGWWRRRAQVEDDKTDTATPMAGALPQPPPGHVRDTGELAEEVLADLERARRTQVPSSPDYEGQDDGRHVTIRIGADGLTACTIKPGWAEHRDGAAISAALGVALRRAAEQRPAPVATVEQKPLVSDALATLISITQTPPTRGGIR